MSLVDALTAHRAVNVPRNNQSGKDEYLLIMGFLFYWSLPRDARACADNTLAHNYRQSLL